jgi:hypothetical protein
LPRRTRPYPGPFLTVAQPYARGVSGFRVPRALAAPVLALVVALSACGGQGSDTRCGADGCTVTFARTGTSEVSVLGVKARLVRVDANTAQVEVAGQTVSVPVGGQTQVGPVVVRVERITDSQVVVRVSPS